MIQLIKKSFSLVTFMLCIFSNNCFCQQQDTLVYISVDTLPKFEYKNCKDNNESIELYLSEHLVRPNDDDIIGKVFVQCVVENDGTLSRFKIICGIGDKFDNVSIDVLKTMPKWKPGQKNGRIVRTQIVIPVKWIWK